MFPCQYIKRIQLELQGGSLLGRSLDILYRISGEMASHIALEILKSAINSCVTVERVKMSRLKVGVLEKERV